jgi:hypothetical protein
LKKPGWPWNSARIAAAVLCAGRRSTAKGSAASASPLVAGHLAGAAQIVSHSSRSRSTRWDSGDPAITAVLSAPIEMPASQVGWIPASCSPSYTPA